MIIVGAAIHAVFAFQVERYVDLAARVDLDARGKWEAHWRLWDAMEELEEAGGSTESARSKLEREFSYQAGRRSYTSDGGVAHSEEELRAHYQQYGREGFVPADYFSLARTLRSAHSPLAGWTGLFLLTWWFVMITLQGEGLDLDMQRRRNPMWEWLLSHPARPSAVFLAEMLAPLAANPNIILAPIFWIVLLSLAGNPFVASIGAGLLIGLPLALTASCLNKTIEICALLKLPPRRRGAVLGLLAWLGFVSYMGIFFLMALRDNLGPFFSFLGKYVPDWNMPFFGWMIGSLPGAWSLAGPVVAAWVFTAVCVALSVFVSARATEQGLSGAFGDVPRVAPLLGKVGEHKWLGEPLYRKELLWFWRDRGAVIQTFLIPISVAAFQLINMHGVVAMAVGHWHSLCTMAVIFGTYFLFILGPRSLLSEGPALWMALTWPRGMEALMKAKARLWWMLANIPVGLAFVVAAVMYPLDWWKVALVAIGWWAFSRSLAEKSVTLVQAASSSGEQEPVPRGRKMAAWLGTFTFASGIASQQWHLALVGVVYSWVTAAAMWQHFRERLPYLFDPWSEKLPKPPTLMNAMVAILGMTEVVAVVSGIAVVAGGKDSPYLWKARAITYLVVGVVTWLVTRSWLARREVSDREIWHWPRETVDRSSTVWILAAQSVFGAVLLGLAAHFYSFSLHWWWPEASRLVLEGAEHFTRFPEEQWWIILAAVVCAPLAEEYLFRGLLYRALDREWGGAKAIWGSAAFFAIYHPPASWIPVVLLGAFNAWLFRRSGNLWYSVAAHAIYNLVVVVF